MDKLNRTLGNSSYQILQVINADLTKEFVIYSISYDSHQIAFNGQNILPLKVEKNRLIRFQFTFTPEVLGETVAIIAIKLHTGKCFLIKAKCFGIENAFELRPVYYIAANFQVNQVIPVEIRNPYPNQVLTLYCAQSQDKVVEIILPGHGQQPIACCPCNPFLQVQPLSKVQAFSISFIAPSQGYIYTHMNIKGTPDFNLTLPIIIRAPSNPISLNPHLLDFGILSPENNPHRIEMEIDTTFSAASIKQILYKPSPFFAFNFEEVGKLPATIPQRQLPTQIGYVVFYANDPGIYTSVVYFQTNSNNMAEIKIKGEVRNSPLMYSFQAVSIDISNDEHFNRSITIRNNMGTSLIFSSCEAAIPNVDAEIACISALNRTHKDIFPKCLKPITQGKSGNVISLKYPTIMQRQLPFTTYLSLLAIDKLFIIPLEFFDSNIHCTYLEMQNKDYKMFAPVYSQKKCKEVNSINLGTFADQEKKFALNLSNIGHSNITIKEISLKEINLLLSIKQIQLFNIVTGDLIENTLSEANKLMKYITLDANMVVQITLSLSQTKETEPQLLKGNENFSNLILINTSDSNISIALKYEYHKGELSFSPSKMRFEPGFPGTFQNKEVRAISTFKVPIHIIRWWSNDPRISITLLTKDVLPHSKTEIGYVTFDPASTEEENNIFPDMSSSSLSWSKSAVSLYELNLWREKELKWDRMNRDGGSIIEATVYIETDILSQLKLPVKAELTKPILVQDGEINFQIVQNDTSKALMLQIFNPSADSLLVQLFIGDRALANYKSNSNVNFIWSRNCSHNTSSIDKIIQTINFKDKSTPDYYSSFEDFVDDYCCNLANSNISELFKFQSNYSDDTTTSQALSNLCGEKEVISYYGKENGYFGLQKNAYDHSLFSWFFSFFSDSSKPAFVPTEEEKMQAYFTLPSSFAQKPLTIPSLSYLNVGPIEYHPLTLGTHFSMIYIKNNLTILYPVKLKGESGIGIIEFIEEQNEYLKIKKHINAVPKEYPITSTQTDPKKSSNIHFKLTQADLLILPKSEALLSYNSNINAMLFEYFRGFEEREFKVKTSHKRIFTIRNSGNMPLNVTSLSIADRGCEGFGLVIKNCQNFTLNPRHTQRIIIEYQSSLSLILLKKSLVFETSTGPQSFLLSVELPFGSLYTMQKLPSLER